MRKELRQEPLSRSAAGIRFDTTALATDGKKKMPFGAACGGEIRLVYGRRRRRTTVAILVMGSAHPFTELLFGADEAIPAPTRGRSTGQGLEQRKPRHNSPQTADIAPIGGCSVRSAHRRAWHRSGQPCSTLLQPDSRQIVN